MLILKDEAAEVIHDNAAAEQLTLNEVCRRITLLGMSKLVYDADGRAVFDKDGHVVWTGTVCNQEDRWRQ